MNHIMELMEAPLYQSLTVSYRYVIFIEAIIINKKLKRLIG
ncbi:MAG: hypothetical protein Q4E89_03855 [Eubacteriales bacterium]|nr:hypothetical protein [Eubacteriales bacterium]